jgi:hypothetical protein
MLKTTPQAFFFDRQAVLKKLPPAKRRVLSKLGAFVRRSAQTSMKYRRGPSKPGQPPSAHREFGALLRKLLFFAYDEKSETAVVGPVAHRNAEAPRLNEFGGKAHRKHGRHKGRVVSYPPRPFMAPALKLNEPRMPSEWGNSIHS